MNTLAEIASAAGQLPLAEQEELLRRLTKRFRAQRPAIGAMTRQEWMARLETLRDSVGTGRQSQNSEQVLEELREERS